MHVIYIYTRKEFLFFSNWNSSLLPFLPSSLPPSLPPSLTPSFLCLSLSVFFFFSPYLSFFLILMSILPAEMQLFLLWKQFKKGHLFRWKTQLSLFVLWWCLSNLFFMPFILRDPWSDCSSYWGKYSPSLWFVFLFIPTVLWMKFGLFS